MPSTSPPTLGRRIAQTLFAALVPCAASAQTVHQVGPGGLAQISHAIALAAPGDTIHVAAGVYLPFTLDKPLTVLGLPGGRAEVLSVGNATTRLRPPHGTTATLARIEFRSPFTQYTGMTTRVERGTVFCEDCLFEAPPGYTVPGLAVENATAVLRGCVLIGNGYTLNTAGTYNAGLAAVNAEVFATDCWLRGSDTQFKSYGAAGEGLRASASLVHLVRCTLEGGTQRHCIGSPAGPGIMLAGQSTAWLADCTVRGGGSTCAAGGPGLVNATGTPVALARTAITGGSGAAAVSGPTAVTPLLGLGAASMPLVLGGAWTAAWRTEPGWPVVVASALELAPRSDPAVVQPVQLHPAGLAALALLVGDANGDAPWTTAIPAAPSLLGAQVFVQAVSGLTLPLQTAPAIGGIVR
jgi:hypothetical protein